MRLLRRLRRLRPICEPFRRRAWPPETGLQHGVHAGGEGIEPAAKFVEGARVALIDSCEGPCGHAANRHGVNTLPRAAHHA